MTDYFSQKILKMGAWSNASDSCCLLYEDRFLRRKVLKTVKGASLLVDLAHATSLDDGDAFALSDGQAIEFMRRPSHCWRSPVIWFNLHGILAIAIPLVRSRGIAF